MDVRRVKKTRGQRKSLIVGIVSSILTLGFATGIILSAINLPERHEIDSQAEGNDLSVISKIHDNYYLLGATQYAEGKSLSDVVIYLYNNNDELLNKISLFNDAEENGYDISGVTTFGGFYTFAETNSIYVSCGTYLFHYTGLNDGDFNLEGYTNDFSGRIINATSSDRDLFVISEDGNQYRIDRFDVGDNAFEKKASGHIYEIDEKSKSDIYELDNYELTCSKNINIFSFEAEGDYIYIVDPSTIRKIHRDMLCNNYRILFTDELNEVKTLYPDKPLSEQQKTAIKNCKEKYGWLNYNADTNLINIPKNNFDYQQFTFYNLMDLAGSVFYQGKYYFADKKGDFYYYSTHELESYSKVVNNIGEDLNYDYDFALPYRPNSSSTSNCFHYSHIDNTCIILYTSELSMVSIFNLETGRILYTVDVVTRISDAFYNPESDNLYYKYQDPVNKQSGVNYLTVCNVAKELTRKTIRIILIIFIILTAITFITAVISWLSYLFKGVMVSVIKTFKGLKRNWIIYVILFPSVLILCLFCYYPGIAAIYTSFFDYKAGVSDIKTWNNFQNYVQIFGNAESLLHFGNMILFLIADVVLSIVPPLIFAFFLTLMRHKKVSGVLRILLFIPGIIPGIAGLLIWRTGIYGEYGLINSIIKASGGQTINYFRSDDYLNMVWLIMMGFPFVGSYLIFYGAMMNIPSSYYEAAEMDGITVWKRFFKIDLPLCFPQIKYVLIMTIIASIQNFSRVYVAMGGLSSVVSTPIVEMYMLMYSEQRNYGLASAYATILFVILFGLTYLSMRNRLKEK